MATLTELVAEVQAITGREADTVLVTTTRIIRWLNEAQIEIVDKCTGHIDLEHKHVTAVTLVASTFSYSIAAISPTIRHLLKVFYLDGANSKELIFRDIGEFDKLYPSPADLATGIPSYYTRRANTIEVYPVPTSSEGAATEITLAETVTDTTWDTAGKIMTGSGSTWATAGATLVEAGDVVQVVSGTNATAGYYQVITVASDTSITLDRSIGATPSAVTYKILNLNKYLRLDYTKKPTVFAAASMSATCDMSDADKGLIYSAVSEAFRSIGGDKVAEADRYREPISKQGWFYSWLDDYRQQKDMRLLSDTNGLLE